MKLFISLLIAFGLGLYSLPYIVRDQVVIWLNENGAKEVTFKDVSMDWVSGEIELLELKAPAVATSKPDLMLDRLLIGIDYPSLGEKRVLIDRLEVDGLHSGVVLEGEDTWIGPVNLTRLTASEKTETDTVSQEAPLEWTFGISNVAIQNFKWMLKTPDTQHSLVIRNADMSSLLQWQADKPTQLNLTGALNGAGFDIATDATPLPETKETSLNLKLNDFPLESVLKPWMPELKGRLSTDLVVKLVLNDQALSVQHDGQIQLKRFGFNQAPLQVQNESLNWQGKGSVNLDQQTIKKAKLAGSLVLAGTQFNQPDLMAAIQATNWTGDLDISFQDGALNGIESSTDLLLNDLDVNLAEQKVTAHSIDIKTPVSLVSTSSPLDQISVSPAVILQRLSYEQGNTLKVEIEQGKSAFVLQDMAFDQIRVQDIQSNMQSLDVQLPKAKHQLARVQSLELKNASYSTEKIALSELLLDQIKVSRQNDESQPYLSQIESLSVSDLSFMDMHRLEIDKVSILDSRSQLTRNKAEKVDEVEAMLAALATLQSDQPEPGNKKGDSESGKAQTQVKVNELVMQGEQTINFSDASVKPKFNSTAVIEHFSVKGVDTAGQELMPFLLKAVVNEHAKVSAEGAINLLGGAQNGHWQMNLENVELPVVSPYAGKFVGYYLKRGQMDFSSEGELTNGDLSGKNHIVLNRLDVQPAKTKATDNFNEKLKMPLGTAIAILQDDKDNIELDIPVEGSLNDPKFGYQSIINRLASKGLKKAALGFLTKSLQPYGALISIASSAISANQSGAFINLAPVSFEPGKTDLSSDMRDYLAKVAGMLNSREGLRLNLCANAVFDDKAVLLPVWEKENKARKKPLDAAAFAEEIDDRLQGLAGQRNEAVISQLLSEKVDKARVFACFPVLDLDNKELKASAALGL